LMRCVRNVESVSDRLFDLSSYVEDGRSCGTVACLVGWDWVMCGRPVPASISENLALRTLVHASRGSLEDFVDHGEWGFEEYGVSEELFDFLFMPYSDRLVWNPERERNCESSTVRDCRDKEAALNRLRKTIYYILRKRELMYDDSGRVRETARRQEGDHNILRKVMEDMEAKDAPSVCEEAEEECRMGSC
jgi:hypothetical protein